jgi:ABC-2 type transport system permease protein
MTTFRSLALSMARSSLRDPTALFFTYLFPVVLMVVLGRVYGQIVTPDGTLMMNSVGPNVVAFGAAFVGMFSAATNLVEWRTNGMTRVLHNAPVKARTILAADVVVGLVFGVIQAAVLVLVSVLPGMGMTLTAWSPTAVLAVVLGVWAFFSLGLLVGIYAPTVGAASMLIMVIVMPMGYVSGAMMPAETLAQWAQSVGDLVPLKYLVDALGGTLTGVVVPGATLVGMAVLAAFGALFFTASTKLVRWR